MAYLLAKDTVNGSEGRVYINQSGRSVEVAGMRNIRADAEIQSQDMRVIGTRTIQGKKNGVKLTGKGNIYYGSNIFTDMVLQYINTGQMPDFDIQITNQDPTTTIGNQVMADARRMLGCLQGRTQKVITGVTVRTAKGMTTFSALSEVEFAPLTEHEIAYYVDKYRPFDKAGAYGIQEWIGAAGIKGITGSFYNVMGLPVQRLYSHLKSI